MLDILFTNKKLQAVLAVVGMVFVVGLVFLSFRSPSSSIDEYPIEGSDQDYKTHARIVDGDDLFVTLGGDRRYDSLSRDLFVFGETAYSVYRSSETEVVGFQVTKTSELKDQKLTIEGRYGSIKNKIVVNLTILKNDRLSTSITDTETNLDIDSKLPSNSKYNKLVASLPQDYEGFDADYSRSSSTEVTIFLDERNQELGVVADKKLQELIDDGSYDRDNFQLLFPTESIGQ